MADKQAFSPELLNLAMHEYFLQRRIYESETPLLTKTDRQVLTDFHNYIAERVKKMFASTMENSDNKKLANGDFFNQFEFHYSDDPCPNAYIFKKLPDDKTHVVITKGLLKEVRNEDELMAVIGHEVGHRIQHILNPLARNNKTEEMLSDGISALHMKNGGYRPQQFITIMERISQANYNEDFNAAMKDIFDEHPIADSRLEFIKGGLQYAEKNINGAKEEVVSNEVQIRTTPLNTALLERVMALDKMGAALPVDINRIMSPDAIGLSETLTAAHDLQKTIYADNPLDFKEYPKIWETIISGYQSNHNFYNFQLHNTGNQHPIGVLNPLYTKKLEEMDAYSDLDTLFSRTWDLMQQLYGDNSTHELAFNYHASILNTMLHQHNQRQLWMFNHEKGSSDLHLPEDLLETQTYVLHLLENPQEITMGALQDERLTRTVNRLQQLMANGYFNLVHAQQLLSPASIAGPGGKVPFSELIKTFTPKNDAEVDALFDETGRYKTPQHLLLATLGHYDTHVFARSNHGISQNDITENEQDVTFPSMTTLQRPDMTVKNTSNTQLFDDMVHFADKGIYRETRGYTAVEYTYNNDYQVENVSLVDTLPEIHANWELVHYRDTPFPTPRIGTRTVTQTIALNNDSLVVNSEKTAQQFGGYRAIRQLYTDTWNKKTQQLNTHLHFLIKNMLADLDKRPIDATFVHDVLHLRDYLKSKAKEDIQLDFTSGSNLAFVLKGMNWIHQISKESKLDKTIQQEYMPNEYTSYTEREHDEYLFAFTQSTLARVQVCNAYLRIGEEILENPAFVTQNPKAVEALLAHKDFWNPDNFSDKKHLFDDFHKIYQKEYAAAFYYLYNQKPFIDRIRNGSENSIISAKSFMKNRSYEDVAWMHLVGSFDLLSTLFPEFQKAKSPKDLNKLADALDKIDQQISELSKEIDNQKLDDPNREKLVERRRYKTMLETLMQGEVYRFLKEGRVDIPTRAISYFNQNIRSEYTCNTINFKKMEQHLGAENNGAEITPISFPVAEDDIIGQTLLTNLTTTQNWPADLKSRMQLLAACARFVVNKNDQMITSELLPQFVDEYRLAFSQQTDIETKKNMLLWVWPSYSSFYSDISEQIWEKQDEYLNFSKYQKGLSKKSTEAFLSLDAVPTIWNGTAADNLELYFEMLTHGVFPVDGATQKQIVERLIEQIAAEPIDQRENLAFKLLSKKGSVFSPTDRDILIDMWVDCVAEKAGGLDDKSWEYRDKIYPYIKKINWGDDGHKLQLETEMIVRGKLQDKLQSQYQLSKELKIQKDNSQWERVQKNGQGLGMGIDGLYKVCNHHPEAVAGIIDFLLQPKSDESIATLNQILCNTCKIELPGPMPLIYAYDNFWSKPFEARGFILNSLFNRKYKKVLATEMKKREKQLSAQQRATGGWSKKLEKEVMTQVIGPQKTEDILARILPTDMPNRRTFRLALKNFAEAVDEDESYRTEFLLVGCLAAAPKTQETETGDKQKETEKNIASMIRLFLEAQGPAGIKVGQFLSAQGEVPDYIRAELTHLTNHAAKPNRIDAFEILEEYHPEVFELVKEHKMGKLIGSASHYLTYDFEWNDKEYSKLVWNANTYTWESVNLSKTEPDVVLSIARKESELKANVVYKRLLRALDATIQDVNDGKTGFNLGFGLVIPDSDATATKQLLFVIQDAVKQAYRMNEIELDGNIGYQQMAEARQLYDCVDMEIDGFTIDFKTMKWYTKQPGSYRTHITKNDLEWSQSCRLMEKAHGLDYEEITDTKVKTAIAKANFMLNLRAILKGGLFDDDRHSGQLKVEQIGKVLHVGLFDTGSMSTKLPTKEERELFGIVLANTIQGIMALRMPAGSRKAAIKKVFPNTEAQHFIGPDKNPTFADCFNAALHEVRCQAGEVPPYLSKVMRALGQLTHFSKDLPDADLTKLALRLLTEKDAIHPDILAGMGIPKYIRRNLHAIPSDTPQAQPIPDIGQALTDVLYKTDDLTTDERRIYLNALAKIITAPTMENPAENIGICLKELKRPKIRKRLQRNFSMLAKSFFHAVKTGKSSEQITAEIIDCLKNTALPARLINGVAVRLPIVDGIKTRAAFSIGNKLTFGTTHVQSFISEKITAAVNQWRVFHDIKLCTNKPVEKLEDRKLTSRNINQDGKGGKTALTGVVIVRGTGGDNR